MVKATTRIFLWLSLLASGCGDAPWSADHDAKSEVPIHGSDIEASERLSDALYRQYLGIVDVAKPGEAVTPSSIQSIHQRVASHPVAALTALAKYDPHGDLGFCFGRTAAVELAAAEAGIARDRISKIFVIGNLRENGETLWRFHVATVIAQANGQKMVVDPGFGLPQSLTAWKHTIRQAWDQEEKAYFYRTDADAVIPDIRVFSPVHEEDGSRIIHLNFQPEQREGFVPIGARTYRVDRQRQDQYFISLQEPKAERFDFRGIVISGKEISYRNYFEDLIRSFLED